MPLLTQGQVWFTQVQRFEAQIDPASAAYAQNEAAGMFVTAPGTRHQLLGTPVLLSGVPKAEPSAGGAVFGQHTDEVLAGLGVSDEQVRRMKDEKVVAVSRGLWGEKKA